ncbi:MAG: hypothetical protein KUG77_27845 [Nannocystaceae bacterium]|nr:hypothetical protein [Nannocystaceae bacterium]
MMVSLLARAGREEGHGDRLEQWTLCAVVALTYVGMAAVLLGMFALFDAVSITLASFTLAAMLWPWQGERSVSRPAPRLGRVWLPLAIGLLAVGLRLPAADYSLAGRDQGTYTLRAAQLLRTGGFTHHDPILTRASEDRGTRSGPGDVLGVIPKRIEAWREDTYEGSYRPGWYLVDRDKGRVAPQFFHLHPAQMAVAGLVFGPDSMHSIVVFEAFLLVLVLFFVARRVLRSVGWASVAALIVTATPLAIWVHRTPLTETPTSLLLWAAVLSVIRCPDHNMRGLHRAALLLGATAWVRGNAWLTAPLLLSVLWLLPGHASERRRPVLVYLTVLMGGVLAHADTTFPYLADELNKQLHVTWLRSPWTLVIGAACLGIAWSSIDALWFDRRDDGPRRAWLRRYLPASVSALTLGAITLYGVLRWTSPEHPHARLDPAWAMFGPLVTAGAILALPGAALRVRLTRSRDVWLTAIAATIGATVLLYAQRNLPRAGLFYYGRYLAPELLPAAALLCTAVLHGVAKRLPTWPRRVWTLAAIAGLLWSTALPLIRTPTVRLREFEGADRLVDAIAEALEPGAIVIAGGEGWHHGHTFNQVGGALAMRHGVDVLPYHSREAAYALAYELLLQRPRARGEVAPPVYLLLGEATHHIRPRKGETPRAAFDDRLPPPFRATELTAFELFTDRLTPVVRTMPGRVTRDELRMVLVRLDTDPDRAGERRWKLDEPTALQLEGSFSTTETGVCFERGDPIQLRLPENLGPGSLVLVMTQGTDRSNAKLGVQIDGRDIPLRRLHASTRHRDTLGPFILESPKRIRIEALDRGHPAATCSHGGLAEVLWLAPDRGVDWSTLRAVTLGPKNTLGHRLEPTVWVPGSGLSRYRPDLTPPPEIAGLSIVVTPAQALRFGPEYVPSAGPQDVVVTLTRADVSPDARLVLRADAEIVAELDPPDDRAGTWQSKPLRWTPSARAVRWSLALESAAPGDLVHVRDIGLFAASPTVQSTLAER